MLFVRSAHQTWASPLLLFLAARLRDQEVPLPDARKFSPEQLAEWIARDKAHMKELREGA